MKHRNLVKPAVAVAALGGLTFTPAAPVLAHAAVHSEAAPEWAAAALDAVNAARAQYGARPVTWNDSLYPGAVQHAQSCTFQHGSPGRYGETLFATTTPGNAADVVRRAVEAWMAQAAGYDYLRPGFSGSTGSFTQVVWKSTTQIAVGFAQCPPNTAIRFPATSYYVVARFSPPGNVTGQFPQNVGTHV